MTDCFKAMTLFVHPQIADTFSVSVPTPVWRLLTSKQEWWSHRWKLRRSRGERHTEAVYRLLTKSGKFRRCFISTDFECAWIEIYNSWKMLNFKHNLILSTPITNVNQMVPLLFMLVVSWCRKKQELNNHTFEFCMNSW